MIVFTIMLSVIIFILLITIITLLDRIKRYENYIDSVLNKIINKYNNK